MSTLTVTTEGQVTLDRDLLQHLGAVPGDEVRVEKRPDGVIEVRAAQAGTGRIGDVFGMLRQVDGPRLSIEEINELTARGWAGER